MAIKYTHQTSITNYTFFKNGPVQFGLNFSDMHEACQLETHLTAQIVLLNTASTEQKHGGGIVMGHIVY